MINNLVTPNDTIRIYSLIRQYSIITLCFTVHVQQYISREVVGITVLLMRWYRLNTSEYLYIRIRNVDAPFELKILPA